MLKLRRYIETEVPVPTDPLLLDDHMAKESQGLNAIHSTIDEENMQVITSCDTAYKAYQAFCMHHCDSGGITTAQMFYEIVNLRLTAGGSVSEHVLRFRTLHNRFSASIKSMPGITISDHFIAILLLMSLPSTYHSLVQTTLATFFEKISLSRVYQLLQAEILRMESSTTTTDSAMIASQKVIPKEQKDGASRRAARNQRVCSLGHRGHTDDYCREQIQQKLDESEKKCKGLMDAATAMKKTTKETAHLVTDHIPSFYDEAFHVGPDSLNQLTLDTAATSTMFGNRSLLSDVLPSTPSHIGMASKGTSVVAEHRGQFRMGRLSIPDVLYSPHLSVNLISAGYLYDMGYDILWDKEEATVVDGDGKEVITFTRDPQNSRLWQIRVSPSPREKALIATPSLTRAAFATLWHRRLGHLHPAGVVQYLKSIEKGNLSVKDFPFCDACAMGKTIRAITTSPFCRSKMPLACVHSDLLGPIEPASRGGKKYIISFIDDFTRYNSLYLLRTKSEAFKAFLHYQKWIESNTGYKILKLKSDRGGEYSSSEFLAHLHDQAVDVERGPANRPEANLVSERFNRTLLGRLRTQFEQ